MKPRTISLLSLFLCGLTPLPATTYHIDSDTGNDLWDGLTPGTAWQSLAKVNAQVFQPGDQVLLKRGSQWTGQLAPQGSGTAEAPILMDAYGDGALPKIDGGGIAAAAVLLYNIEYWEVSNLEITNPAASDSINRIGIRVYHDTGTVARHIHLKDLWVHHVRGSNDFNTGKSSGGIQINAGGTFLHYDDVLIQDCLVHDVSRVGITVNGAASNDTAPPTGYGTNIIMRGNHIYNTGGDGSIIRYCDYPLIEHNVVHDFPAAGGAASYVVGLWCRSTRHALFQYNEVYNAKTSNDGQGYDADIWAEDTVFQFNYSHNNQGGFMLIMGEGSRRSIRTIVRYNLSVNDRGSIFLFSLGTTPEILIHNNTFYIGAGLNTTILNRNRSDTAGSKITFYNNLIYNLGSGGYSSFTSLVSDYNCYFGNHPASEPVEPNKITADPQLVAPGSGGLGIDTLAGYRLHPVSPLINAGAAIADPGPSDFWGNFLDDGRLDIGAHEFPPVPVVTGMQFAASSATLHFTTTVNRLYTLERSETLAEGDWLQVDGPVAGTGGEHSLDDSPAEAPSRRFYRICSDVLP